GAACRSQSYKRVGRLLQSGPGVGGRLAHQHPEEPAISQQLMLISGVEWPGPHRAFIGEKRPRRTPKGAGQRPLPPAGPPHLRPAKPRSDGRPPARHPPIRIPSPATCLPPAGGSFLFSPRRCRPDDKRGRELQPPLVADLRKGTSPWSRKRARYSTGPVGIS